MTDGSSKEQQSKKTVDSLTWSLCFLSKRIELFQVAARRREDGDSALQGVCGSPTCDCVLVWREVLVAEAALEEFQILQ